MTMSESSMAMTVSKRAMKNIESMALDMARQTITECASLYGFSAEDAMERLGASTITLRGEEKKPVKKTEKTPKAIKSAFPMPFTGEIQSDCCQGIKANRGLFSQCAKSCKKESQFCNGCAKQAEKNANGEPDCGVIAKRMLDGDAWRDPKGRAPISFRQLMKKMKLTEDQVLAEVARIGATFNAEKHFAEEPAKESKRGRPKKAVTSDTESSVADSAPKKRGRPKKAPKTLEVSATEDLFANLVQEAKSQEAEMSDLSGSDSDSDAGSKKKKTKLTEEEKAAKIAEKTAKKAAKEQAKEAEKEQKKLAREAERTKAKAEKEAKEAQEKAEKLAAKAAAKAEKEAKEAEEKAVKAAAKAAKEQAKGEKPAAKTKKSKKEETPAPAPAAVASEELIAEAEEEEAVKVEKFEIKGTIYLKSADNTLYDLNTQDEIGVWNPETKEIEECEDEESDSDSDEE